MVGFGSVEKFQKMSIITVTGHWYQITTVSKQSTKTRARLMRIGAGMKIDKWPKKA